LATRVVIVRHGESTFNQQERVQGQLNDLSVLTDKGESMAVNVGEAIADIPFDAAYASPLKRAHRTAELVLTKASSKTPLQTDDRIKEVYLVAWEGLTFKEVQDNYPEQYQQWRRTPHLLTMETPDGKDFQPIHDLQTRAIAFWQAILPQHKDQTILIVGHSGINRALINSAIGLGPESYQRFDQSNCGISILNFTGGFGDPVQIESLNLTAHMGLPIPKPRHDQAIRLLLVRHGETQWNREGRFQGQIDIPLNDNGRLQASQAGTFLQSVAIDSAITSSMARPKETAELILKHHPEVKLDTTDILWEISHGLWERKRSKRNIRAC
jgi:phosphoserine phosphatase